MNIYIGNISYDMSEEELQQVFGEFGEVTSVKIITDRETGRSKGFGFVEMAEEAAGTKAIEELDGSSQKGRNLKVNKARPRKPRNNW